MADPGNAFSGTIGPQSPQLVRGHTVVNQILGHAHHSSHVEMLHSPTQQLRLDEAKLEFKKKFVKFPRNAFKSMINVNFSFKKTELSYIITENQQNSFKMSPGVHKCGIIIV